MRDNGIQRRQMLDQGAAGARAVSGDQQITAVADGDLSQGGVGDLDVVGGGERAGRTRPLLDRQGLAGVGAPRGQREEPVPLVVGLGSVLVRGRLMTVESRRTTTTGVSGAPSRVDVRVSGAPATSTAGKRP